MNKHLFFLFIFLLSSIVTKAELIDGIHYWLNSADKTAIVYNGQLYPSPYSGDLIIPNEVVFNNSTYRVVAIAQETFKDNSSLTSVSIPSSINKIGYMAFAGCNNLASIIIPNGVIDEKAFYKSGLIDVIIGDDVTSIGSSAFRECTSLSTLSMGANVKTIKDWAFYGCVSLTSVSIPNSVKDIETSAFDKCYSLTNLNLGNSVSIIGSFAFCGCKGLNTLSIPRNVEIIGYGAFSDCSGLTSIIFSNGLKSIEQYAFLSCTGLTTVLLPDGLNEIGPESFANCQNLSSINIPNSVTNIGGGAFRDCPKLNSVRIPESVTYIGQYIFQNCKGLQSISIGGADVVLEACAFSGLSGLVDFFCYSANLPNIINPNHYSGLKDNVFNGSQYNATLHVPAVSVDLYKTQKPWSEFKRIVALTDEETGITTTNNYTDSKWYKFNLGGQRTKMTKDGIYVLKNDKGLTKKIIFRSRQ
jgi:hypothetical protein